MTDLRRVLVTGATGYIGGRLTPHLVEAGYRVRVMVRDPSRLSGRSWLDKVEVVHGDALRPETLPQVLQGVDVAYYFIHSLYAGPDFHELDLVAARDFGHACAAAGVKRIIYLGGLGDPEDRLSPHLRSRQLTGAALREGGVPVAEFRSAIVIGSGSGSLEMIRYLTERIPVMTSPRWVKSLIQPIAIDDVLDYLTAALEVPESADQVNEIGGTDVMTYAETLLAYAKERSLPRVLIPLPVLTPGLSSHWVGWVTPVSARIARPLIEGLRNDVIVRDDTASRLFPNIHPMDYQSALRLALADLDPGRVDTASLDAQIDLQKTPMSVLEVVHEGMHIYRLYRTVTAPSHTVYRVFASLGGERGWLYANWAWRLRGFADRLAGGIGFRRGRRHPDDIRVADAVDFLRAEAVELGHLLRLRVEAKMPGQFWLQFETRPLEYGENKSQLIQTIFFVPKGLLGLVYWSLFYRLHTIVFSGLIREVARQAELLHQNNGRIYG
jgi:uncharacterized protein YbjT (DUF2867 family)